MIYCSNAVFSGDYKSQHNENHTHNLKSAFFSFCKQQYNNNKSKINYLCTELKKGQNKGIGISPYLQYTGY